MTPTLKIWNAPIVTERAKPITYKQFVARSMRLQRKYIRDERAKMHKLDAARLRLDGPRDVCGRHPAPYRLAAAKLGMHALSAAEIEVRFCELTGMEGRVPETHGDSETMKFFYQVHLDRHA